ESVNGFLKMTSVSSSVTPRLNKVAAPISISSQSLIGANSIEADGPKLVAPGRLHSPAAPMARIAVGSFSWAAAAPANAPTAAAIVTMKMPVRMHAPSTPRRGYTLELATSAGKSDGKAVGDGPMLLD